MAYGCLNGMGERLLAWPCGIWQHGLVVYGCLNGSERLLGQHGLVVYGCLNGSERLLVQHGLVVYGCLNGSERLLWATRPSGIWMPKWK